MKNIYMVLMALVFIASLQSAAWAAPDTYIGDAAIYSALDNGSDRPRPNVLFIIDNSAATTNISSGEKYVNTTTYPNLGYNSWDVYVGDNQGNFNKVEVANPTSSLGNISCSTAVVKTSLQTSGTYSGAGSVSYPNLRGGACDTGPMGASYALGNYLNYLKAETSISAEFVVAAPYTYITKIKGKDETVTEMRNFKVTVAHTADATNKPGSTAVGATWPQYWAILPGVSSETTTTWVSGKAYAAPATSGNKTQRQIVFDALNTVIDGARYAVNFGALTYGNNNSGGKVVGHMSDLRDDTVFTNFLKPLPGSGSTLSEPVLSSNTGRPQSESLYDAGFYFDIGTYPGSTQSIGAGMSKIPAAIKNPCGYNHIILITNGLSNGDGGSASNLGAIGDYDKDGWANEAVYGDGSHYLDDVAKYIKTNFGITTHTILAFQAADSLVQGAAERGGGKFYNVYDANALSAALTKLLTSIVLEADTSFVAPVVPASSTNRTISSNRVYLGLFKPQNNRPWLGNLKKYGVSSDLNLLDRVNTVATDATGDFLPNSKSFWGTDSSGNIMSMNGTLPLSTGGASGDGGNVGAGGVGGTLLVDLKAGLASSTPAWQTRNIYTWPAGSASTTLTHADNRFSPDNAKITATTLAVADATKNDLENTAEKNRLINFVAGADGYDDDKDGNSTEIRDWVLGDILHSKPLIFSYNKFTEAQEADCSINKSLIFVGSNDGMFHAFRDCDGKEVWAFIPDNVLPNLKYLRETDHHYFADGAPTAYVHDINGDNIITAADGDKVVLIFGQGRGGGRSTLDADGSRGAYYALDVSNPLVPVLLWKIDSNTSGFGELGETWSAPRLARVKVDVSGTAVEKVVAFVGAGYDNNEDLRFGDRMLFPSGITNTTTSIPNGGNVSSTGSSQPTNPRGRGIFAIEIARLVKENVTLNGVSVEKYVPNFGTPGTSGSSGSLVWSFVHTGTNGMNYSIPSDLTVLDMNGDGFQDRIYVGDMGGQLWRFNVGATNTSAWNAELIFKSNQRDNVDDTNVGRKIFYKPTMAMVQGVVTLYFGTGDRNHPLNTAVVDRMFAVKDKEPTLANPREVKDIGDLEDLTLNELQLSTTSPERVGEILTNLANNDGWYIDLNEFAGEKVLAPALIFNKQAFFTTYAPNSSTSGSCEVGNLGSSRLYQFDYATGEATQNYYTGNDTTASNDTRASGGDGITLLRRDRVKNIGVGIPSGIVSLIDASGKVTLMISSSNRVGTYQAPDAKMISPLYWLKY